MTGSRTTAGNLYSRGGCREQAAEGQQVTSAIEEAAENRHQEDKK